MAEIDDIRKAIENIKEKYSRDAIDIISDYNNENETKIDYRRRQIYELLQNADDCHTDKCSEISVKFELSDNILIIQNTGKPFDARGTISLMHPNASSKYEDTIGCKGLGFRAVLNWAKKICIYTKEFAVEFSEQNAIEQLQYYKEHSDSDNIAELERIDRVAILSSATINNDATEISKWLDEGFSTSIILYCDDEYTEVIQNQLKELQFEELLFLKHIRTIDIVSPKANRNIEAVNENGYFLIQEQNRLSEWIVWSKSGVIPQDNGSEKNYELIIAYNNDEQAREKIRKDGVLYSYFKTEIPMPFPFLVHGTFELTSERNSLIKESKNNEFLLEYLVDFISEKGSDLAVSSEKCDYSALKFLLPAQSLHFLDKEYSFTAKLKDKIKNYKLFPTINGTYISIEDNPKYSEYRFDKYVSPTTFSNLIKYCDDATVSAYIRELGINFYYDRECVELINADADFYTQSGTNVELIKLYYKQYTHSNIAPKILVDSEGHRITEDDIAVFNNADNRFPLPTWSEMRFIDNKLEKALRDYWVCSPRRLMEILASYGCKEYSFDRVLGELISQSKSDKNKVTDLLRWLYDGWINNNCSFESSLTNVNVRLLSREGEIVLSSKCFFGKEYNNNVGERIVSYLKDAVFVADCETLGLPKEDLQSVKTFLSQLGVEFFPKIESRKLEWPEFYEYKNYNSAIYTMLSSGLDRYTHDELFAQGRYRNSIEVADIDGLNDILANANYVDILYWILNDRNLYYHLVSKNEVDDCSNMTGCPYKKQYSRRIGKDQMRSWLRRKFSETEWLPTKNGRKVNCNNCTLASHELSPMIEILDIDYTKITNVFGRTSKKEVEALLENLGVAEDVVDLPYDKIYEILLKLPDMDSDGLIGKPLYAKLNRHFDSAETNILTTNNKTYNKFMKEGRVLANVNGKLQYRPIGEVYYVGRKIYSDDILKDYPTIVLPRRAGDDKIQQLFGVRSIKDIGAIKVIEVKHILNDEFQTEYQKLLPYIYAKRIGTDTKNIALSKLKSSKIILVKEARTEHDISGIIKEGTLKDYELIYSEGVAYIKVPELIVSMSELRNQIKFNSAAAEIITTILDLDGDKTAFSKIFECASPTEIETHFRENDEQTFSVLNQAKEKFNQQIDKCFEFWNALATTLSRDIEDIKKQFGTLLPVDFDYNKINDITNLELIIDLFKKVGINVDDYNSNAYEHITLKPYFDKQFREFKVKYRNKYLCYFAKDLLGQGLYKEDFEIREKRYDFYVLDDVPMTNSIYFDFIPELEKEFGVKFTDIQNEDEDYKTYLLKLSSRPQPEVAPLKQSETSSNVSETIDYVALNADIASQTDGSTVSPKLAASDVNGGSNGGSNGTRHGGAYDGKTSIAKETDGFIAESKVYNTLLAMIKGNGSVEWVSGNGWKAQKAIQVDDSCGYDMKYIDENGHQHYVEVKGTSSENLEFILTKNEFNFAQSHKEQYELWFVFIKDGKAGTPYELGNIFMFNDGEDFFNNQVFSVEYHQFMLKAKIV